MLRVEKGEGGEGEERGREVQASGNTLPCVTGVGARQLNELPALFCFCFCCAWLSRTQCEKGPCGPGNERCVGPKPQQYVYHLSDETCAINDPNGPFYDEVGTRPAPAGGGCGCPRVCCLESSALPAPAPQALHCCPCLIRRAACLPTCLSPDPRRVPQLLPRPPRRAAARPGPRPRTRLGALVRFLLPALHHTPHTHTHTHTHTFICLVWFDCLPVPSPTLPASLTHTHAHARTHTHTHTHARTRTRSCTHTRAGCRRTSCTGHASPWPSGTTSGTMPSPSSPAPPPSSTVSENTHPVHNSCKGWRGQATIVGASRAHAHARRGAWVRCGAARRMPPPAA